MGRQACSCLNDAFYTNRPCPNHVVIQTGGGLFLGHRWSDTPRRRSNPSRADVKSLQSLFSEMVNQYSSQSAVYGPTDPCNDDLR